MTCSRARLWASSRASSSSRTAAASDAALPSPPCASSTNPPAGEQIEWIARFGIVSFWRAIWESLVATVVGWLPPRHPRSSVRAATIEAQLVRHFQDRGWVVVDAVGPAAAAALPGWVDEIAALADGEGGVLQHFERTDTGPVLCRSENFVPVHAALRALLCTGALVEFAGALLGEPAVLYKEKVNYKLPGGAGYSPHQDAPAYPMIDVHVSAMVAVDDADESNGGLEVVSGCFDTRAPPRRARLHRRSRSSSNSTGSPCRCTPGRRCGSTAARRTAAGPTALDQPRRALYPTYNAARGGRPPGRVLRRQTGRVRGRHRPATARGSRSSATSKDGPV